MSENRFSIDVSRFDDLEEIERRVLYSRGRVVASRSLWDVWEHYWAWTLRLSFGVEQRQSGVPASVEVCSGSCAWHSFFVIQPWSYLAEESAHEESAQVW